MATKKYKLKQGYTFGPGDEFKGGDEVELTEYEAGPILYMFEQPGDAPAIEKSLEEALGDELAVKLHAAGVHSLADVRDAGADLERMPGIGAANAKKAREAAKV